MRCLMVSIFVLVCLAGCSGSGQPPLYPVRGRVLVDGKPVADVFVMLHSLDDTHADMPRPSGRTDTQGYFNLSSYTTGDGAPAGDYVATCEWKPRSANPLIREGPDRLEGRYSNPKTSGLKVRVKKKVNDLPPFELQQPLPSP